MSTEGMETPPEAAEGGSTTAAEPGKAGRSFKEMNLDPAIQQALDEMGFEVPMEVQEVIYDRVVAGKDLMVQSRTGSGKTAAYGIPIAQAIQPGTQGVQALMLCPTRELALQVSKEVGRIVAYRNLQVVPVYGGAPMGRQIDALKAGAQIVAGTPGRVLDHIRRGTLKTKGIRMLVLDECDEMLSMGFLEEIEKIISELPKKEERQTLLFSATVPEDIERVARRHMREFEKVKLSQDFVGVHSIEHRYYIVSGLGRTRDLQRIIEFEQPESAIIFCNTRDDTTVVAGFLQRQGYIAEPISSDLTQADRERVMGLMRERKLKFLCATDIAARGIDISDLSHVINYTFPESPEVYIHRTGRTGRAGKSGVAISLIGPREIGSFYYLKLLYKIKPEERELPTDAELRTRREGERWAKIADEVAEDPGDEWRSLAKRVWVSENGERIMGAILKRILEGAPTLVRDRLAEAAKQALLDEAAERKKAEPREKVMDEPGQGAFARPDRSQDRDRGGRGGRFGDRDRGRGGERDRRGGDRDRGPRGERDRGGERGGERREARGDRPERDRDRGPRPEGGGDRGPRPEGGGDRGPRPEGGGDRGPRPEGSAERSADRGPERDRGPRPERADRGDRVERPRRERPEGERRERRPEGERKPGELRHEDKAGTGPLPDATGGREFWEAWVDDKQPGSSTDQTTPLPDAEGVVAEGAPTEGGPPREPRERRERRPRREETPVEPGFTRLYVNVGKREGLSTEDVTKLVTEALPDAASALGPITVHVTHTYVIVKDEHAQALVAALGEKKVGDREIKAEPARR